MIVIGIKERRHQILSSVDNTKIVKVGNHNLHSSRVCAVCGRPLTSYDNFTATYTSVVKHYHYYYLGSLSGSLCYDINSCRSRIRKGGDKHQ